MSSRNVESDRPVGVSPLIGSIRTGVGRRTERSRATLRARSAFKQLSPVTTRGSIEHADVVLISVMRNEAPRLPFWLRFYEQLGVDHFLIVDNGSTDDTIPCLSAADQVTVYRTEASYKDAEFGVDWVNAVAQAHCRDKWVLFVDSDEFLSFDGAETRGLPELVRLMRDRRIDSLQCLLLDLYSRQDVRNNVVRTGESPFDVCNLFDGLGYGRNFDPVTRTTWITGGVRDRMFFGENPVGSPALNKTPLVRWSGGPRFLQSAHRLAPAAFNSQSDRAGLTGVLLHQRFLASVGAKMTDSAHVQQHNPEYARYIGFGDASPFSEALTRVYTSSDDLVGNGLMSRIDWDR